MASSTGIPERPPLDEQALQVQNGETEPLLGRPGDAAQGEGVSTIKNLILGTGILAQLGVLLLAILIWASVFTKPVILFSGHPLLQSLAIVTLTESVLTLQPTHTPEQKRFGQRIHASLNLLAFLLLVAGITIIEYNKFANNGPHFHSVHGYLGVITSIVLLLQYLIGFTMWATPSLYGGDHQAKSIWKYHRYSGYAILVLLLATTCSAAETDYSNNVLKLKLWSLIILSILILVGVFPRIQLQKLGLKTPNRSS